jgi:hypothetical protein
MPEPTPDPAEPVAPRREFRFKPTEFERANRPLDGLDDTPAVDVRILHRQASQASGSPAIPPAASAENDVHAILRANLAQANEDGCNDVILRPKRPSRRKQDYWLMFGAGNLGFSSLLVFLGHDLLVAVCVGAGVVLYSLGLTWIMWFVMDDY